MGIDRESLIAQLRSEGLDVTEWSDEPHATYPAHTHAAREVRIILEGAMRIMVGDRDHELAPGDRIDLAPNEPHSAVIGPAGCTYLAGTDR
jgi:quercetin dioxygenase-like cupin family protein